MTGTSAPTQTPAMVKAFAWAFPALVGEPAVPGEVPVRPVPANRSVLERAESLAVVSPLERVPSLPAKLASKQWLALLVKPSRWRAKRGSWQRLAPLARAL